MIGFLYSTMTYLCKDRIFLHCIKAPQPTTNIAVVNIEDNSSIFYCIEILVKAVLFLSVGQNSKLEGDEKLTTMQTSVRDTYRSNEKK